MAKLHTAKQTDTAPPPAKHITQSILVFRGHKVLLDEDLAALYGVQTGALVQAVKRNSGRFPADFMFQLTAAEWTVLRSRIVISRSGHGGRRYPPYVFTEQGVAMLTSVLGSERAIAVNIEIMRAFVKMRELLASHRQLAARVERLETNQKRHSSVINILADEIDQMKKIPETPKRRIGFKTDGLSESLTMAHVSR